MGWGVEQQRQGEGRSSRMKTKRDCESQSGHLRHERGYGCIIVTTRAEIGKVVRCVRVTLGYIVVIVNGNKG